MTVDFKFKLKGLRDWEELEISPEQYFDPPDEDETLDVESVVRHLDLRTFIPVHPDRIGGIVVTVTDEDRKEKFTRTSIHWGAEDQLSEWIREGGKSDHLVIIS